jgi:RHS repeat-associated protein
MRCLLLCLFLCLRSLHASTPSLDADEEDLSLHHHVNVISGHLSLCMQDLTTTGARPLSLTRTYSSAGALERDADCLDLTLKNVCAGFLVQGGWNFLPHTHLFVQEGRKSKQSTLFVYEKSGSAAKYTFRESTERSPVLIFAPEMRIKCAATLSARKDPNRNRVHFNPKKKEATLFAADGYIYRYTDPKIKDSGHLYYLQLSEEISPSGHVTTYTYDNKHRIKRIASLNPSRSKTFSWIEISVHNSGDEKRPFHFSAQASSGEQLEYRALVHERRNYLCTVTGSARAREQIDYAPGRKGIGAHMRSLSTGDRQQFIVHYYEPSSKKEESLWCKHPETKSLYADRVRLIEAPLGPRGELIPIASFTYAPEYTDVRDHEGVLTRYRHYGTTLTDIETFDPKGALVSHLQLQRQGGRLISKTFLGPENELLFSKTFTYDAEGNVTRETLVGSLTGNAPRETYTKEYTYNEQHLLVKEEEEGGLTTLYSYKPNTDLVTTRRVCFQGKPLLRECSLYDDDNLLTLEILDDGSSPNPHDLTDVTQRTFRHLYNDPTTGQPIKIEEGYGATVLKCTRYSYSAEGRPIAQEVFDAAGELRYTLHTEYDRSGNVISQTTPTGAKNTYLYNAHNERISAKEVGTLREECVYNGAGLVTERAQIDARGERKTSYFIYDAKLRLLQEIDERGHVTDQEYDAFGRCITTLLPPVEGPEGNFLRPALHFQYDPLGNITAHTSPRGETFQTHYNTLKKPLHILYPDGTELQHRYTLQGQLIQTLYADGSSIQYAYDPFQRMTLKQVFDAEGILLSAESWEYNAFSLLAYTNPQGVKTTYTYDGAGRKIEEQTLDRVTSYSYDALGFLERTTRADISHTEIHDVSGQVIETWQEDTQGHRKDQMHFLYDEEGRKVQAARLTAQGRAVDSFSYDGEGRLASHTDPLGHTTYFLHTPFTKTTIDPFGNRTLETYDALKRRVHTQRQDPQGRPVGDTHTLYDLCGNPSLETYTVYDVHTPIRTTTLRFEHDSFGRLSRLTEAAVKTTHFTYDIHGNPACKTLPSGVALRTLYDPLGRLLLEQSSDGSIHTRYTYDNGLQPLLIEDCVHNLALQRTYTPFGELSSETHSCGLRTVHTYDTLGRRIQITLPDNSTIRYHYQGLYLTAVERPLYTHRYDAFDPNGHVSSESLPFHLGRIRTVHDLLERPAFQITPWHTQTRSYTPHGLASDQTNTLIGDKQFTYDPLSQLASENATLYHFDSLGNPTDYPINALNQVLSTSDTSLIYDLDGNPTERTGPEGTTHYTYDALGRLTTITTPTHTTHYIYDPLSRLLSKEEHRPNAPPSTQYFLYDDAFEIGTCDASGHILQLKVLGLGIQGDIGAAVAIELEGSPFIPLHDFNGHIIALTTSTGALFETYPTDAFGKQATALISSNPWRFASKRVEGGLIFFGLRFYDPSLGRWLTPDPSGPSDGPNLYAYLLNNPINRLDLFGLFTQDLDPTSRALNCQIPLHRLPTQPNTAAAIPCKGSIDGVPVDWVVMWDAWHKLDFSPEELSRGHANFFDHFVKAIPKTGPKIGLITIQNGINTSLKEFDPMVRSVHGAVAEGTPCIGLYNPSKNIASDLWRVSRELRGRETGTICRTRQMLVAVIEMLHNINPDILCLHVSHSEGGLIAHNAQEGMTPEQRELTKKHLLSFSLGPARPISNKYTRQAVNTYSKSDFITQWFALGFKNNTDYTIQFTDCTSSILGRTLYFADHKFSGDTYTQARSDYFDTLREQYGFYDAKTR